MNDEFRTTVLDWLERRGWSQARLAEATEISQSLVSKHLADEERRRVKPSPANLERYAPVLGVSYEDLLRMCGYLPGTASTTPSDPIEDDIRARTAEFMNALKGIPRIFWPTVIKAVYDQAIAGTQDMADLLQLADEGRSADIDPKTSANEALSSAAIRAKSRRYGRIKPRFQAVALSI